MLETPLLLNYNPLNQMEYFQCSRVQWKQYDENKRTTNVKKKLSLEDIYNAFMS